MKTHKKQLALVIAALLTASTLAISNAWAVQPVGTGNSDHHADSDKRSNKTTDSGKNSEKKMTICHIPKGNPANKHTIHIGVSAWPAHRDNHGDYLGSCDNPPSRKTPSSEKAPTAQPGTDTSTTTQDTIYSIVDCQGSERQTLLEVTQTYFKPIVVSEDALKDEAVAAAVSQCLDKGDSSDSSDGNKHNDKSSPKAGAGHDSVSDSGKHHLIRGCKNKGSKADSSEKNDSSKSHGGAKTADSTNHLAQLNAAVKAFNEKSPEASDKRINIISDSSMDDKNVRKAYNTCMAGHHEDSDSSKHHSDSHAGTDSAKLHKNKGDSGHKYREVRGCSNADAIQTAVDAHHKAKADGSKSPTSPILVTKESLTDKVIEAAVDACVKSGAKKIELPPERSTGAEGTLNQLEKNQR